MKGRLRIEMRRDPTPKLLALSRAKNFLSALKAEAHHHPRHCTKGEAYVFIDYPSKRTPEVVHERDALLAGHFFNEQIDRITYAMEHPESSLKWIEGEGFRLFSDSGDEEVLFKLGRGGGEL